MKGSAWIRNLIFLPFLPIIGLIGFELLCPYDILSRRVALMTTAIVSSVLYLGVYFYLEKRFKLSLPTFTAWAIFVAIFLDAAGNFGHLYGNVDYWDKVTHAVGSASTGVVIFTILVLLNQKKAIRIGHFALFLWTTGVATLLAVLYELTEYWGDLGLDTRRIGDRFDTVSDLQWNVIGVLIVTLIGLLIIRRKNILEVK